jgi:DHA1 family tetracycline resistance protein-like MFS transporter
MMTRLVSPDQQGQLQGATTSVHSIAELIGPFLFTMIFAYFIGGNAPIAFPGAPFLLAGALLVVAMLIAAGASEAVKSNQAPQAAPEG